MSLDVGLIRRLGCSDVTFDILDSYPTIVGGSITRKYSDGSTTSDIYESDSLDIGDFDEIEEIIISFNSESGVCDSVIISAQYFIRDGTLVGSSLVQSGSCELKLLKYKVELPRGAKVTLFDDESIEAKYLAWNIPCPISFPNMTFLQVKAANGFEQQLTPSTGSQTIELYMELGRRYAVFGEIWTYSYAQTLWLADLRVQLSDDSWQDCIPTAGEGGTIVTALPQ